MSANAFGGDLLDEIKEGPDFCRRQMSRGMIGVQRIKLFRPIAEHLHQIAVLVQLGGLEPPTSCSTDRMRPPKELRFSRPLCENLLIINI